VYSAVWRVRSAVDGHVTSGSVGFSVGEASPLASLLPPPGTADPATAAPSAAEAFARWLAYLSATVAVGSLAFGCIVWRPTYQTEGSTLQAADETVRRLIRRLALGGLSGLGIATVLFVIVQAAQARELSLWSALAIPPAQLWAGRIGFYVATRMLLIVVLGIVVLALPSPGNGSVRTWLLILLLGGAILLTFSLLGHGAARGSAVGVVMIWLHFAATALWLGGLPMLFLSLRLTDVPAPVLVPRFSNPALVSVGVLVMTGLYNGITFVGTTEALTATTYGRSLIVKTAIFASLLALGAINLLYISPHLREIGSNARNLLSRTVRFEMALAVVLLSAVGVLSGVFPAFEALQSHRDQGLIETARVDGVNLLLRVAPAKAGDNEIGIEFSDRRPGAEGIAPEVLVRLTERTMNMGTQQVEATSIDGRRYSARGTYFPMAGPWELEIIIRRPGFNDVRQAFEVEIQDPSSP
jgi:copper transport protein